MKDAIRKWREKKKKRGGRGGDRGLWPEERERERGKVIKKSSILKGGLGERGRRKRSWEMRECFFVRERRRGGLVGHQLPLMDELYVRTSYYKPTVDIQ